MTIKSTLLLLFFMATSLGAFCQSHRMLRGHILDATTNLPVKNIDVSTSFDKMTTNDSGEYALNLEKCTDCQIGNTIFISTFNDAYGFSESHFGLPKGLSVDVRIPRTPNIIGITGIIKDARSGKPLSNIKVRIASDFEPAVQGSTKTDVDGIYKFLLKRDAVGNLQFCKLICKDEQDRYASLVETRIIASFLETYLEPNGAQITKAEVARFTKTGIKVYPGDVVTIKATGNISVGDTVGSSDPDGLSGLFLNFYNIVRAIKHAALMYRVGNTEWKLAGKAITFTALNEGDLELLVNDNEPQNNQGAYSVEIAVAAK